MKDFAKNYAIFSSLIGGGASGGNTGGDSEDSSTLRALIEGTLSGNYVNDRVTSIGEHAFTGCKSLASANLPGVTDIGESAFEYCTNLTNVNLPEATGIGDYAFKDCTSLTTVDFPLVNTIGYYAFRGCTNLTALILRNTKAICKLTNPTMGPFAETPIESGTGYIYVPSALIEDYKAASSWSAHANQFRAIEDYPEICGGDN